MKNKQIDEYLLDEMSKSEREKFEDQFFSDDELFFQVADRENTLVDRYVRRRLEGKKLDRFERSLEAIPARRQKVANARQLHELIADERDEHKAITIAERESLFARIANFFSLSSQAFQFASAAAVVILAVVSIFLFVENRKTSGLRDELAAARAREAELTTAIEDEQETSTDLTAQLEAEQQRVGELEAALQKSGSQSVPSASNASPPMVATLIFRIGGFRGGQLPPKNLKLASSVRRVSVLAELPSETSVSDVVSVKLNGVTIARGLHPRQNSEGEKNISFAVSASNMLSGRNQLSVLDWQGNVVTEFFVIANRDQP